MNRTDIFSGAQLPVFMVTLLRRTACAIYFHGSIHLHNGTTMHIFSHINTAVKIIDEYKGNMPLAHYLKNYFAQHKKHGSKDRKAISALCYSYYRIGHALINLPAAERLKVALFLCKPLVIKNYDNLLPAEWLPYLDKPTENKISFIKKVYPLFSEQDIFPFANELSSKANQTEYALSCLSQSDFFIRARPGYEPELEKRFQLAGLSYKKHGTACFAFANNTKIDDYLEINKEAVVQDFSSQKVGDFLLEFKQQLPLPSYKVWDCCAASGGKSILSYDILKSVDITVSDIRPAIMHNLNKRFRQAGIRPFHSFIADITSYPSHTPQHQYDLIICDAPCSGSGTWSRTPEQSFFFDRKKIDEYSLLQKNMVKAVMPYLSSRGSLLYVTCSVFSKENEEIAAYLQKNFLLNVKKMELLKGLHVHADTIFAALLSAGL